MQVSASSPELSLRVQLDGHAGRNGRGSDELCVPEHAQGPARIVRGVEVQSLYLASSFAVTGAMVSAGARLLGHRRGSRCGSSRVGRGSISMHPGSGVLVTE